MAYVICIYTPSARTQWYDCTELQRSLGNVVQQNTENEEDMEMGKMSHRFYHMIAPDDTRSNSANKPHNSSTERVQPGIAMQPKSPLREAQGNSLRVKFQQTSLLCLD